ncbi:hypothetical protein [Streptacidiphilus sp. EB103A]|uniref:hypothetical protein n=1 Tax=Streptacidiphilus sp. EB103A TaxID=3156275 RepID=UPI0035116216
MLLVEFISYVGFNGDDEYVLLVAGFAEMPRIIAKAVPETQAGTGLQVLGVEGARP